jgi:hypothetical protein
MYFFKLVNMYRYVTGQIAMYFTIPEGLYKLNAVYP